MGLIWAQTQEIPPGPADPDVVFEFYKSDWYKKGLEYWESVDSTVDGMLGGFPQLSERDALSSCEVIELIRNEFHMGDKKCAEVGAGIGRITKMVLSKYFNEIDIVEPVEKFIQVAIRDLKGICSFNAFTCGAQDWRIVSEYDCFWLQWTLMFLRDDDAVEFLKSCKIHLSTNGFIVVKDNVANSDRSAKKDEANWYPPDRSIARTYLHYLELFELANLILVKEIIEEDEDIDISSDSELMPVYIFVLH